jgi:hypothetical protein
MPVLVGVLDVHTDAEGVVADDGAQDKGSLGEMPRRIYARLLVGMHVPLRWPRRDPTGDDDCSSSHPVRPPASDFVVVRGED